jgi:hypothetical protein
VAFDPNNVNQASGAIHYHLGLLTFDYPYGIDMDSFVTFGLNNVGLADGVVHFDL